MNPGETRCGWLAPVVLILGALAPAALHAQTEAEKKSQAKDLYERATRLYDVGKYGEAINAYEQAYLLIEDPALLFNIGQAYRLWDRPEEAVRAYKNYLRKRPDARNRADVERKIADLERTIEERRGASGAPPPALPQPSAAPAGSYQVGPAQEPLAPAPEPVPVPMPPPPAAEPMGVAVAPPAETPAPRRNWLAYGLLAGGGACLVFSAVMAAVGRADAQKLADASKNHQAFDPTVEKNGKAANALAIIGLVAGVATGGVGGYLLWRGRGATTTSAVLVPTLTPSYAGGSAVVTF